MVGNTGMIQVRKVRVSALVWCAIWLSLLLPAQAQTAAKTATDAGLKPILNYISSGWNTLTRSMTRCESVVDPKLSARAVLYLPADFPEPPELEKLQQSCKVTIQHLPVVIHKLGQIDTKILSPAALLFLPNPYVVPGGRFNEMYGWDSYFIIRGLLQDGRIHLARGMVDNFFFEIEHYGAVLNANRAYYLTRSQPPFLTSMILGVYEAEKEAGKDDRDWLARAYNYANRDYELWVRDPHLAGNTGLARYYDFGEGPVAEGLQDENGYYRKVAAYYLDHPEQAKGELVEVKPDDKDVIGFTFPLQLCESYREFPGTPRCQVLKTYALTPDFYKGDRSMRESGFDISYRFGPFGSHTHDFAPVCLNSLLYKTEKDLEQMSKLLGHQDDAVTWSRRAAERKQRMNQYLWDQKRGLFMDFNFKTETKSTYDYITTYYPLWAGLATPEQAKALAANLRIFEQPGGLDISPHDTGGQWDYPYGWAPTQLVAIEGLRRYGFDDDANRVSYKFLSTVAENFRKQGIIVEKYNVVNRSTEANVSVGYQQNVIGFGWTNAAFLALLHALPADMVDRLASEQAQQAALSKSDLRPQPADGDFTLSRPGLRASAAPRAVLDPHPRSCPSHGKFVPAGDGSWRYWDPSWRRVAERVLPTRFLLSFPVLCP